jgi:hypothetical protein
MSFFIRIIAASVLTALVACAPTQKLVKLPPERSYHNGFSLIPLNEEGWYIGESYKDNLNLRKYGTSPDETYVIYTEIFEVPSFNSQSEFVDFVKQHNKNFGGGIRFNTIKEEAEPYSRNGVQCVRSNLMFEDTAAKMQGGGVHTMVLEMDVMTCVHPTDSSCALEVIYSHRNFPDQRDPTMSEKAKIVFDSVEFSDKPRPR